MSGVIWPGDLDSYFRMCRDENARDRADEAARRRDAEAELAAPAEPEAQQ